MNSSITFRNCMMATLLVLALIFTLSTVPNVNASVLSMEWGIVNSSAETFVSVDLNNTYLDPVIVVTPEYTSTTQANGITVWLANVTNTGFEFKTSDENGASSDNVEVHYLVVEKGNWTLPTSGIKIEAGSFDTVKTGSVGAGFWSCPTYGDTINFNHTFDNNPLVLMTRGSNNNPSVWGTVFTHGTTGEADDVGTTAMCAGLSVSKAISPGTFTSEETVFYIAIDEGSGTIDGAGYEILWNAKDTGDSTGNWINGYADGIPFSESWSRTWTGTPEIIVVGTTTVAGSDGGWPVLYDAGNTTSIRMFVDEANERGHSGSESGGGFAFNVSGSYSENAPNIVNATFNDSTIQINTTIELEVNVTDLLGNFSVEYVNATFETPNGTSSVNYSLTQIIQNSTLNGSDAESGTQDFNVDTSIVTFGESGTVNISNFNWTLVEFNETYVDVPVVLATVTTRNRANNDTPLPAISSVNTTHVNITICLDDGSTTCPTTVTEEQLHYFVFDPNVTNNYSWIEVGTVDVATDGAVDTITFNKTFSNTPDMFGLGQSFNAATLAPITWFPTPGTTSSTVVACDHPGTADACAGTSTEKIGYVAIDSGNAQFNKYDSGSESIPGSAWTAISYGQTYDNPMIMVTVNSENGGQDPASPMAVNVTGTGAEIRYCEQDTGDYCDTHNAEDTDWFVVENGAIQFGEGSEEVNKTEVDYTSLFSTPLAQLNNLTIYVNVDKYDNSGSTANANTNPDIELFVYDGSWRSYGSLNVTSTGLYSSYIEDSTVLSAWLGTGSRSIRLQAKNLDYNSSVNNDNLSWDLVIAQYSFLDETATWRLNYSNTSVEGVYNVTSIVAKSTGINWTNYTNFSFTVNSQPIIILYNPENNSKFIGNGTVEYVFRVNDDASSVNCSLVINGVVNTSTICTTGTNTSLNITSANGEYVWSVNVTDPDNGTAISDNFTFTTIQDVQLRIRKTFENININQYLVRIMVDNLVTNSTINATPLDFIPKGIIAGSYNTLFDIRNETFGPLYIGNITTWNISLPPSTTQEINYSIIGTADNYSLDDALIFGLE